MLCLERRLLPLTMTCSHECLTPSIPHRIPTGLYFTLPLLPLYTIGFVASRFTLLSWTFPVTPV